VPSFGGWPYCVCHATEQFRHSRAKTIQQGIRSISCVSPVCQRAQRVEVDQPDPGIRLGDDGGGARRSDQKGLVDAALSGGEYGCLHDLPLEQVGFEPHACAFAQSLVQAAARPHGPAVSGRRTMDGLPRFDGNQPDVGAAPFRGGSTSSRRAITVFRRGENCVLTAQLLRK